MHPWAHGSFRVYEFIYVLGFKGLRLKGLGVYGSFRVYGFRELHYRFFKKAGFGYDVRRSYRLERSVAVPAFNGTIIVPFPFHFWQQHINHKTYTKYYSIQYARGSKHTRAVGRLFGVGLKGFGLSGSLGFEGAG